MTLREYFRSFFTREYWEALGSVLASIAFIPIQLHRDGWNRPEEEPDEDRGED
ncbi:hypothetical protein HZY97_19830 [Sphingomonas sp. R-74633]|uniref:hypothetical protein n=1 Tax=Sphingomonas sp. R-74633 TaxID=2751188 RepID=UPI0015D2820A|nr:hypothetical protein [Sphingomonas sp. R-74633]NYT43034.1 hypothetical protein [Sphingomonas sp. R-74633]